MSYVTYDYKVSYYAPGKAGSRVMTVNAPYESEARELVEGMVPGANVIGAVQGQQYNDGESVGGGSGGFGMDEGGFGILCALILGGWLLITFWPVILILGALGLFAWVYKVVNEED